MPVQQPQYGRDAAHISWAAWVLKSLEDYMNERQHHLNESSSARLGRSQQLEILPSPNSKQTQSLGADFYDVCTGFAAYILIGAEILTSALFLSYSILCGAVILQFSTALPPIFDAYICRLHLPPIFAAYICRIYFGYPHIFWTSPYILVIPIYFGNPPIL